MSDRVSEVHEASSGGIYGRLYLNLEKAFAPGAGNGRGEAGALNIDKQPFSIRTEIHTRPLRSAKIALDPHGLFLDDHIVKTQGKDLTLGTQRQKSRIKSLNPLA